MLTKKKKLKSKKCYNVVVDFNGCTIDIRSAKSKKSAMKLFDDVVSEREKKPSNPDISVRLFVASLGENILSLSPLCTKYFD